jgi:hypothetical protein
MAARRAAPLILATTSVALLAGVGIWGWTLAPDQVGRWAVPGLVLLGAWGYIELMQYRGGDRDVGRAIMNFHRYVIAWVGLMLAFRAGVRLAVAAEWMHGDWIPTVRRVSGVMGGGGLALAGNYLPKLLSPWRVGTEPFDWQSVHRFGGWLLMLGGLAMVAASLVLPVADAKVGSVKIFGIVALAVVGRKVISLMSRSGRTPVVS